MSEEPRFSYIIIFLSICSLLLTRGIPVESPLYWLLFCVTIVGSLPTFIEAIRIGLREHTISIAAFNSFAVIASLITGEWTSAVFITLMLSCARILDAKTTEKMHRAVEELIKLKPSTVQRENGNMIEEIPITDVQKHDIIIVRTGDRIGVDGIVTFGHAFINESSVTGETAPKEKGVGDIVVSSSLNESGLIKLRATRVGKDSTIERIASLIREATQKKSHVERTADRFARAFLPFIVLVGICVYLVTNNVTMMAAIFLVACADDLAVAIPLAITASIGKAAQRGVLIKGGAQFESLAKIDTLVFDKTGTLTLGTFSVDKIHIEPQFSPQEFWQAIACAEKYSEHPIGKALYRAAVTTIDSLLEPDTFSTFEHGGVTATYGQHHIVIGNTRALATIHSIAAQTAIAHITGTPHVNDTTVAAIIDHTYAGYISITDTPRPEAQKSIETIMSLGITPIMFTGDNTRVAHAVAKRLGISHVRASMLPGDKLRELAALTAHHTVGMLGDGINDAPSLARAHMGIAMGGIGTAVATEAADAVILSDNLSRIPEMILLSRKTMSVVRTDIAIWLISNSVGISLVLMGIAGPAGAAFYNFLTDFLPIINSARLFASPKQNTPA